MQRRRWFLVSCVAGLCSAATLAFAAIWYSSDRWGSTTLNGYTLYNNVWGGGAGPQTIWANSGTNWGVWANHPNTGGIKSYPNATRWVGRAAGSIGTLTSSFNITTPSGGAWVAAYDIWDSANQHEIMLWMNYTGNANGGGNVKPISFNYDANGNAVPVFTNVNVGGSTWNVFRGHNGGNNVYSFVRTSKTNSATVDAKAIINWIRARGWFGNVTMGNFQFGYEITSSSGGMDFRTNSYSFTSS